MTTWWKTESEMAQGPIQVSFSHYSGCTDRTPIPADSLTVWKAVVNKNAPLRWTNSLPTRELPLFLTDITPPLPAPELTFFFYFGFI